MAPSIPLLCLLYAAQGFPFGLVTGSLPALLKEAGCGYEELGRLQIAASPYAVKLLLAPLVDTVSLPRVGKRKSWIVPCNLLAALLYLWMGTTLPSSGVACAGVGDLTALLLTLVLLMALQDVAVDAWALEVPRHRLPYAAVAETMGMTVGNMVSYPVFLTLRGHRVPGMFGVSPWSLPSLLCGAAVMSLVVAGWAAATPESPQRATVGDVLGCVHEMLRSPRIQQLCAVLLVTRAGLTTAEGNTLPSAYYVERGGNLDDLAVTIAAGFPLQLAMSLLVARAGASLGHAQMCAAVCAAVVPAVLVLGIGGDVGVAFAFALCSAGFKALFTAQAALFNSLAPAKAGATSLTLLNTAANLGRLIPRYPVFAAAGLFGYPTVAVVGVVYTLALHPLVSRLLA